MQERKQNFFFRIWEGLCRESQWFRPGLGYKRWLVLVFLGTTLLGLGLALIILDVYHNAPETWWLPALAWMSLRFLHRPIRVIVFGGVGIIMVMIGIWGANRSLLQPFLPPGKPLIEALDSYRRRDRGPRIVVLGGGHGLACPHSSPVCKRLEPTELASGTERPSRFQPPRPNPLSLALMASPGFAGSVNWVCSSANRMAIL